MDYSGTANGFDDDIDDIMASIMQSSGRNEPDLTYQAPAPVRQQIRPKKPAHSAHLDLTAVRTAPKKKPSDFLDLSKPIQNNTKQPVQIQKQATRRPIGTSAETAFSLSPQYYTPVAEEVYYDQTEDQPSGSNLLKVSMISVAVLAVTIVGGAFLWQGPISNALKPKSPFSTELAQKTGLPLYFPTKLPGTYKMETNSIAQPDPSAVVYVISDNDNNKLNVSLQKQSNDLDLSSVYGKMTDLKEIETRFGPVKIGTIDDGLEVANVFTGQTWIIITSEKGTITDTDLQTVINGLEI